MILVMQELPILSLEIERAKEVFFFFFNITILNS